MWGGGGQCSGAHVYDGRRGGGEATQTATAKKGGGEMALPMWNAALWPNLSSFGRQLLVVSLLPAAV